MSVLTAAGLETRDAAAQAGPTLEYRVLATSRTSTMERELNDAAEAGFRYQSSMGGDTAIGGSEVVVVAMRGRGSSGRFVYKLLATSRTSTMEKELNDAGAEGFEYRGQTVFTSAFGGQEVVCILERDSSASVRRLEYRLFATAKTSTLQNELATGGAAGFEVVGLTVANTALGGKELVAITRRVSLQ